MDDTKDLKKLQKKKSTQAVLLKFIQNGFRIEEWDFTSKNLKWNFMEIQVYTLGIKSKNKKSDDNNAYESMLRKAENVNFPLCFTHCVNRQEQRFFPHTS